MRKNRIRACLQGACLLLGILATGCSTEVLHGIPEAQATQVVAVLGQHGIPAEVQLDDSEANLWRIAVPKGSSARAFSILADYKLPRVPERRFKDIFGQRSLVRTPMEESALYLEGLQGELAHTLESLDGIIEARVHIVMGKRDRADRPLTEPRAAVMVEYQPTEQGLNPIQASDIQKLIANSVESMVTDQVAVVLKPASIAAPSVSQASDFSLVTVGPLVVEESALPALKIMIAFGVFLIGGLGFAAFWQGRMVAELRDELAVSRTGLTPTQKGN